MNRLIRTLMRYGIPLLILAGGAVAAADKADWPSPGWFNDRLVIVCVFIPFAGSAVVILFAHRAENRHYKRLVLERQVRYVLATPMISAIDDCSGNWRGVSVHVYQLQKLRRARSLLREERHVAIAKLGLSGLGSSGVSWGKDKGVIGRCWHKRQYIVSDLAEFNLHHDKPPAWKQWGTAKIFNLSYDEYQKVGGKYCTIAAAPMTDHQGKYIGCVVLNSDEKLKNVEIMKPKLQHAAGIIVEVLAKVE